MNFFVFQKMASVAFSRLMPAIAGLFLVVCFTQATNALPVSVSFSGTIDRLSSRSAEPYFGTGDSYAGNLMFDIDASANITNVSGNVNLNGYENIFTGYAGHAGHYIDGSSGTTISKWFSISPLDAGAVGYNEEVLTVSFNSLAGDSLSFLEIINASDTNVSRLIVKETIIHYFGFSSGSIVDLDDFVPQDIQIVPAVPLPTTLPLYAAGLAILGFVGWRKKQKST